MKNYWIVLVLSVVWFFSEKSSAQTLVGGQRYNDIEMLAMRSREPGNNVGNQEIDSLSPAQVQARLELISKNLAQEIQRHVPGTRTVENAMKALVLIGPPAVGTVPVLANMLAASSSKDFNSPVSFCELARALVAVGGSSQLSGRAVGEGLLRVQQDTPRHEVCHMCSCALGAMALTRGAAATEAGPFLVKFMKVRKTRLTNSWDLQKALAAVNPSGMESVGFTMLRDKSSRAEEQIGVINQMLAGLNKLSAADQQAFFGILRGLTKNENFRMREIAMTGLSRWGVSALNDLTNGLQDPVYLVRRAAAAGLATLGPKAAAATAQLAAGLDPILGAAGEVSAALVAIGGPGAAAAIRAASPKSEPWIAYYESIAKAAEKRSLISQKSALSRHFTLANDSTKYFTGKDAEGPLHIAVEKKGEGIAYMPDRHRLRLKFQSSKYGVPDTSFKKETGSVVIYKNQGALWTHLKGVQAGEKLRLFLSPPLAISAYYGTKEQNRRSTSEKVWQPTVYEVSIEEVCEPKFWTLWRESGIFGAMVIETGCSD